MNKNAAEVHATRVSPEFFAIDRGAFRCAAVGGPNVAVAHLVLARGTGAPIRLKDRRARTALQQPHVGPLWQFRRDLAVGQERRDRSMLGPPR
jgi:hypothetical protein